MTIDPVFWSVVALAAIVVGLAKSGLMNSLGMIGVPLLTLVMPARDAAGMMLPVLLCMDAVAFVSYRKSVNRPLLMLMLPGAMIGIGIAWALSSMISDEVVTLLLGIITLMFVLDAWLPLRKKLEGLPPSRAWGTFWAGLAGITSFISHAGGPPYQIYTLPQKMEPRIYAGTSVWFFTILNVVKLVPYFALGQINISSLEISAVAAPIGILAVALGIWLVHRISTKAFYQIAYSLMFVISLKLIYDGARGTFGF
ncbi:MAG: sulfite exporter TauE/SafE family protein [Hyphomicrobiaceae bacterium]|nr:sulfite exporter TauE/SafE family protein [Hyphomicrobiaceae bacterium]MCC0024138.1 sulfite exporter TauE/SafE family protein [Hyphomicrobiaceae bacterium]